MGRAELHSNPVIPAHSHGEDIEPVARCDFREQCEMRRGPLIRRRNAHESRDIEAKLFAALGDQSVGVCRGDTGFLRFLAGIDLDKQTRCAALAGAFFRKHAGELRPIDGFNNVKERHGLFHLVGL